jgi:hypothetical protein
VDCLNNLQYIKIIANTIHIRILAIVFNTIGKVWDATQMSNWLLTCNLLIDKNLSNKLFDGERNIPKKLLNLLSKYLITDFNHFICGIDDYQRIMFIYSVDADIHYFFDCDY